MPEPAIPSADGQAGVPGAPEPSATPQAPGPDVAQPQVPVNEPAAPAVVEPTPEELTAQLEEERKARAKIEMERNQLRKRQDQLDKQVEDARQAEMSDLEKAQTKLAEYEAKEARREAEDFRKSVIAEYPDERTRQLANAMITANESNLLWNDNVASFDEAKEQLVSQLDALKSGLPEAPAASASPSPVVGGNNQPAGPQPTMTRDEAVTQAAKNKDWRDVLMSIPSVQEQVKMMQDE